MSRAYEALNFLRHYYDVYKLLENPTVLNTSEYIRFKKERFRLGDEINIRKNEAFLLNNSQIFKMYENQYEMSKNLYYKKTNLYGYLI